jgi:hypothetical protein
MRNKSQHTINSSNCYAVAFADACVTCCSCRKIPHMQLLLHEYHASFAVLAQPCRMPLTLG